MIKAISSAQNPWLKEVLALQEKNRHRKALGRFTVEGLNEVRLAMKAGLNLIQVAINPKKMGWDQVMDSLWVTKFGDGVELLELNDIVWAKVVVKESGLNVLAVFELPKQPAVWAPKDGSADSAGANGVVLCDERIDGFHPQVIRNSVGTAFTVPLFVMDSAKAWDIIEQNKVKLFTTFMEDAVSVWDADLSGKVAMIVGTEHQGVSDFWRGKGVNVNIPMFGTVDSLNVSVAASLLMYEAKRQRK